MERDEQFRPGFTRLGDPVAQAQEDVAVPCHHHAIASRSGKVIPDDAGHRQRQVLFEGAGHADGARIDPAMPRIEHDDTPGIGPRTRPFRRQRNGAKRRQRRGGGRIVIRPPDASPDGICGGITAAAPGDRVTATVSIGGSGKTGTARLPRAAPVATGSVYAAAGRLFRDARTAHLVHFRREYRGADRLHIQNEARLLAVARRQHEGFAHTYGAGDIQHQPHRSGLIRRVAVAQHRAGGATALICRVVPRHIGKIDDDAIRVGQREDPEIDRVRHFHHETRLIRMHAQPDIDHRRARCRGPRRRRDEAKYRQDHGQRAQRSSPKETDKSTLTIPIPQENQSVQARS